MATFSKVIYDPNQAEIAKVNRVDGTLYLNSKIWKGLPANEREFVLLHEKGHLNLQTKSEFEANEYAVSKFAPSRTLTNQELGKRIVVMKTILNKGQEAAESGFSWSEITSGISDILKVTGIGSKARENDSEVQMKLMETQARIDEKKTNTTVMIGILVGVILIVSGTLYFILKK